MTTADLLCAARAVKPAAAALSTAEKNRLLEAMAQALLDHADNILAANAADVEAARGVIAPVMIDRLSLSPARVESMAEGMRAVAALPDPVGELLSETARSNGLVIRKVRVPMGVIAIIYESRPNVTADAAALCLKSGNVCVLRGGKEAIRSNTAVVAALRAGLEHCGAPGTLVNLVEDTSRASAAHLMEARGFVDLLIPRGGKGLIRACVDSAKVPCIETGTGICHIYVYTTRKRAVRPCATPPRFAWFTGTLQKRSCPRWPRVWPVNRWSFGSAPAPRPSFPARPPGRRISTPNFWITFWP